MSNQRVHLTGLFAVLLALMAQIGVGAMVPRIDPVADASAPCGSMGDAGGGPAHRPGHPADCPVCPPCVALHAPIAMTATVAIPAMQPSAAAVVIKIELPPPSTAPPSVRRPPGQPRAPADVRTSWSTPAVGCGSSSVPTRVAICAHRI